jgi:hypothetical protein
MRPPEPAGIPAGVDCLRGLAALAAASPAAKRTVRAFLHHTKRAGPDVFGQVATLGASE